ncbi:MAG: respiratory nitrate reductase subunit gamma [Streptosporangiaceae bacterium]
MDRRAGGDLRRGLGTTTKGVTWRPAQAVDYLRRANGTVRGGVADGRPSLAHDVHLAGHGYDYRTTVAPWFRGLFSGSPDVTAIATAPVVYQVHAASAWLIWAVWPFSRLVHA